MIRCRSAHQFKARFRADLRNAAALIALLCMLSGAAGCSDNQPVIEPVEGQNGQKFKVSVTSGGREVKDFNEKLVQRVAIGPDQVEEVLKMWPEKVLVPFDGVAARDGRGKVMGVRVGKMRSGSPTNLGLRPGDIVTAVNAKHASTVRDLGYLFVALREQKTASLTFEREGKPHKILYYVAAK